MFGMRKVKIIEEIIYRPLSGTLLKLEEVPDPTFSKKMLGEGVAIERVKVAYHLRLME